MGGGIRMGNTCKPMAVLFQCMTKFTTNKKKKKKCLSLESGNTFEGMQCSLPGRTRCSRSSVPGWCPPRSHWPEGSIQCFIELFSPEDGTTKQVLLLRCF